MPRESKIRIETFPGKFGFVERVSSGPVTSWRWTGWDPVLLDWRSYYSTWAYLWVGTGRGGAGPMRTPFSTDTTGLE